MQVSLNVYDVTNTANDNANGVITRINNVTRELNLGGVFHGAVQLDDVEWSFGYCESGTGIYCCRAQRNNLYTFREHIELGVTNKTRQEIKDILSRFKRAWPGNSYDLLQRNCCHLCEELCAALEVPSPPAWLNRFAQGADATVKFTNQASALARRVGSNLTSTAQASATWLREMSARVMSQISLNTDTTTGSSSDSSLSDCNDGPSEADRGGYSAGVHTAGLGGGSGGGGAEASTSRSESAGAAGRLSSRFRRLAAGAGEPAAAAGTTVSASMAHMVPSTLPASTHASSPDLQLLQGEQQQRAGSLLLPSVLRQKWQELEASAGDGTKQFLFGLIKTRQGRLDDDELPNFAGRAASFTHITDPYAPRQPYCTAGPMESNPLVAEPLLLPTQPPQLQVIGDSLLPSTGLRPVSVEACALDMCTDCPKTGQEGKTEQDGKASTMISVSAGLDASAGAALEAGKCIGTGVVVSGASSLREARLQPVGHLLDM